MKNLAFYAGISLVLVSIASVPCRATTIVFSATAFGNSLWDVDEVYSSGPGGAASGWQVGSGGHAGAYRRCRISMNAGGPGAFWAFHQCLPFSYDPSTQGAVDSVDYFAYMMTLSVGFPRGQNTGPAIRQDGVVYAVTGLIAEETTWTPQSLSGLTEDDFHTIGGSDHPDFSTSGSPFDLGFITGDSSPKSYHEAYDVDSGIDNWTFAVHYTDLPPVPEPLTLLSVFTSAVGLGGYVRQRLRTAAQRPVGCA